MKISDLDKQIIRVLFENGRESFTNLNKKFFKSTGIKKRITKLQDSHILKIQGNTNVNKLNYEIMFILMNMNDSEDLKELLHAYSKCPRVFLLADISGQYNVIMGIFGTSIDVLHRYLNHCGPTNQKGVSHSLILFNSVIKIPEYLPLNMFRSKSQENLCGNVCNECEAFLDGICEGCENL